MFKRVFHNRKLVGLDVGASSVKAVELSGKNGKLTLTGLGVEPLSPGAVASGLITNQKETSQAIEKLFRNKRLKAKRIAASLNGYSTILKNILVPRMTEEELSESFAWHAEENIPFDMSEARLDYQVLGSTTDSLQVMLAACKLEAIENLEQTLKLAGQRAEVIDFKVLALHNCYTYNYQPAENASILLLDIGAFSVIINIVRGHRLESLGEFSIGGYNYTNLIEKELGLTFEAAEATKMDAKIDLAGKIDLGDETAASGEAAEAISKSLAVKSQLELMTEKISGALVRLIQRELRFWCGTSDRRDATVPKILISGGGSRLKGLKEYLELKLAIRVEELDPFRRIKTNARRFSPDYLRQIGPEMAVAVGLALRGTDEPSLALNLATSDAESESAKASLVKTIKRKNGKAIKKKTKKVYLYKGRNQEGEIIIGEQEAKSQKELRDILRRKGIILTFVNREALLPFLSESDWKRQRVSTSELENFARQCALMIEMGAPLMWSLHAFAEGQKNKDFKQALDDIVTEIGKDSTLTAAMRRHPDVFDEFFVNMCEAGETGGILDIILNRLQGYLETKVKFRRHLKLALLYPASLLALAAVMLMLTAIVLRNMSGEAIAQNLYLRFWTRVATATGTFISGIGGVIILVVMVISAWLFVRYLRTARGRRRKDELLLRMPLLGEFLRKIYVARYARRFSILLSSGVPIIASLDDAINNAGNLVFADAIKEVRNGVYRGKNFSESMNKMFPAVAKHVVGYGEMTGGLDAAHSKVADLYEEEVNSAISKIPLATLSIAIVLFVLLAFNLWLLAR